MKIKYKTVLLLLGTLVLGIVFGIMIHATFIRSQFRRQIRHIQTPIGFMHHFEKLIEPTEEQQIQFEKVLKKHFVEMEKHRTVFRALMDSLKTDIDSILTEEQRQRLQKSMFLERPKPPRGAPFPPPDFMKPPGRPPEPPNTGK